MLEPHPDPAAAIIPERASTLTLPRERTVNGWGVADTVALAGVWLIALAVRAAGLPEQSVSFDEYNALLHHPEASLYDHLLHIWHVNQDHMPLYFIFVYFWMKFVSMAPLALRVVSILLGAAMVPVLAAIGYKAGNHRGGLWAGLLLALSPLNGHMHQSLRYYSFVGLLSAVSVLVYLYALDRRDKRFWVLLALLNTVLAWTHLMTLLLAACQFGHLLLRGEPRGRLLQFAVLHGVAGAAAAYWLIASFFASVTWYDLPGLGQWVNDLLGDDALGFSQQYLSQDSTFSFLPGPLATFWVKSHWVFDVALLTLMGAAAIWNVLRYREARRAGSGFQDPRLFFLVVAFAPVVLLTVLSVVWQPVLLPRYTMFSSIGLYLLAGYFLAHVAASGWAWRALALVLVLYGYQLSLSKTGCSRSDLNSVAQMLEESMGPRDALICADVYNFSRALPRMLRLHLGPEGPRIYSKPTLYSAVDQTIAMLSGTQPQAESVWIVMQQYHFSDRSNLLEDRLRWHGLRCIITHITDVLVFEVGGRPDTTRPVSHPHAPALSTTNRERAAESLGLLPAGSREAEDRIMHVLRSSLHGGVEPGPELLPTLALNAVAVDPETGEKVARRILERMPYVSWNHFAVGMALLHQDRETEGRSFIRAGCDLIGVDELLPMWRSIGQGDMDAARANAERAAKAGACVPEVVLQYLGMDTRL